MTTTEARPARSSVGYKDLRGYLEKLEAAGLLKHITAEVELKHEIGAICAVSFERQGPALIFDNIKGYAGKPLVTNIISTVDQLAIAFNTAPDADEIYRVVVDGMNNRLPSVTVATGPCKDDKHTGDAINLYELPTPVWHELDRGPYIGTTAGNVTRDPATGQLNLGTYRCMIVDKNTLTVAGVGTDRVVEANEAKGQTTPIAIVLGMDPLLTLASGTPVPVDEHGYMEYEAAGAWRGSPTELVKCETSDLLVPANAEYIIEGEIRPGERLPEGPHGEATGFYGQNDNAKVIHVTCVTHRKKSIAYGLICLLEEDYPRWIFRSGSFLHTLIRKSGLTSVKEAFFPEIGGWGWGFGIIRADIESADEPKRIIEAAWDIAPNRWFVVVDSDCDIRDWNEVMWRVVSAVEPDQHVWTGPLSPYGQRRGEFGFAPPTKAMGIDATFKFKDMTFPPINKVSKELKQKALARFPELGLG